MPPKAPRAAFSHSASVVSAPPTVAPTAGVAEGDDDDDDKDVALQPEPVDHPPYP